MTSKELHNSIEFNEFVLQIYSICKDEYHSFTGTHFPARIMRAIEMCYFKGLNTDETALYINTH